MAVFQPLIYCWLFALSWWSQTDVITFLCVLTPLITWPVRAPAAIHLLLLTHHISVCRSGFRTDAPSGRSARRPPMCSALRGLSCRRTTACLSSRPPRRQQPPWATASAPSTPTTPAGLRRGCPVCLSCRYRRLWAASRPWRSLCLSVASAPGRRPTPWVYPTCRPTAPGFSHTSTSPLSPGWYPRPCRARPTWPARLSCVAPRTVTSGEGQASPHCAAKRSSTQYPWVSPSNESREELFFPSDLLHLVLTHPSIQTAHRGKYNQDTSNNKRQSCCTPDMFSSQIKKESWSYSSGLLAVLTHRTGSVLSYNLWFRM